MGTRTPIPDQEELAGPFGAEPGDPFGAEPERVQEELAPAVEISANLADLTRQYIDADRRQKELENELKEVKAAKALMEPILVERFSASQIQNQKLQTGETVYIRRDTYVSLITDEDGSHGEAHEALRRHGLDFLVKPNVNSQQLSGWYREKLKMEEEIPQDLLPYLNIADVFRVRVRQ